MGWHSLHRLRLKSSGPCWTGQATLSPHWPFGILVWPQAFAFAMCEQAHWPPPACLHALCLPVFSCIPRPGSYIYSSCGYPFLPLRTSCCHHSCCYWCSLGRRGLPATPAIRAVHLFSAVMVLTLLRAGPHSISPQCHILLDGSCKKLLGPDCCRIWWEL